VCPDCQTHCQNANNLQFVGNPLRLPFHAFPSLVCSQKHALPWLKIM
jgi:hypothetical protein